MTFASNVNRFSLLAVLSGFLLLAPTLSAEAATIAYQDHPGQVGQLTQMLGMTDTEYQAEIDAGKTPLQIAEEHGMRKEVYLKRIGGGAQKSLHSKSKKSYKTKKTTKKPVKKLAKKVLKKK